MKNKLMLFLFRFLLWWDGWKLDKDKKSWRYQGRVTVTGDGSEIARLVMRRLLAGERLKLRK